MFHRIRFTILKRRIKKNPYIGKEDIDRTYLYKEDGYSIRYRIIKVPEGQAGIQWLSHKRHLTIYEEEIKRLKKGFSDFWHYQRWLIFFRPPILLLLIISIVLFYFKVVEKQEAKVARIKWLVASAVGITPKDVQYIGDGWLEISGHRKRKADRTIESIRYTFNPLRWLFFSEGGMLDRWRGKPYGDAAHPAVVYNERGDVWLKKEGTWRHGIIIDQAINWDTPQGSRKVTEQEISLEGKELEIIDKK